jgi:hypothetical protein
VPLLDEKVPPERVKLPLTDRVVVGAVNVPPDTVKSPETVMLLVFPVHVPPAIEKPEAPTVTVWF